MTVALRTEPIVSREKLFDSLGYKPHSKLQWDFHQSNARFRVTCCGRRWGKTTAAGNELTAYMFTPDKRYWIVGPSYRLGEKEFRVVHDNLVRKLKLGSRLKVSYNVKQGDMRIYWPELNTTLEVVSADRPDSLIGDGLDGVVMSEAATHKQSTWEMYIEPALSDLRGWAILPSTPRGYNWFQGAWQMGQDPDFEDYASWRMPTWTNLAAYPGGREDPEIKRIERVVSKQHFLQEIAAEFTAFEGKIYEEFDPRIHVREIKYNPQWKNYRVFDFGFADPFVCLDIMVDPSDNVYVWREYQERYQSTWEHGNTILRRENPLGYHCDAMYGDPRGADEIATLNLILGHVVARAVGWAQGIEAVKRNMKLQGDGKPKLFIDRSCIKLISQLEQLRFADAVEGKNSREKQHDYNDHGPDALRYFFSEYFVLRPFGSLADVYGGRAHTEAATFFQNHTTVKNEEIISF